MAEKATATSSAEIVPALTKSDARDLKSLITRDTKILKEELEYRSKEYSARLQQTLTEELNSIAEERDARNTRDQELLVKAMGKINRQVEKVNEAIRVLLAEMEDDGWHSPGSDRIINRSHWVLELPSVALRTLRAPKRDDSDLKAREEEAYRVYGEAFQALEAQYREALRQVTGSEANVLRELTLQSITTEAAREFILEMPSSSELLPPPPGVEALPGPVDAIPE